MPDLSVYESVSIEESIEVLDLIIGLEAAEEITILESVILHDIIIELEALEDIEIFEYIGFNLSIDISVLEEISTTELIDILDIVIELTIYDELTTSDVLGIALIHLIEVYDEILTIEMASVWDIVIELGIVWDEIEASERAYVLDIIVELLAYENISGVDRIYIDRIEDFSEFLRGYPFVEITLAMIDRIEFENGVIQMVDRWGRTKRSFEITLPVSTKEEAMPVREFFERNLGQRFYFSSPIDGRTYTMTFIEDSYRLERSHYNTYFASVKLIEVF